MNRALASIIGLSLAVLFTLPTSAQNAKPDDDGFIRDWLFLGPFPLGD